jgi:hypothetical protein
MLVTGSAEVTSQDDRAVTLATSWPTVIFAQRESRGGNFLSCIRLKAAQNDAYHLNLLRADAIRARILSARRA